MSERCEAQLKQWLSESLMVLDVAVGARWKARHEALGRKKPEEHWMTDLEECWWENEEPGDDEKAELEERGMGDELGLAKDNSC